MYRYVIALFALLMLSGCGDPADPLDRVDGQERDTAGDAGRAVEVGRVGTAEEARMEVIRIPYTHDDVAYEGAAVYESGGGARPLLVMVPNWLGMTEAAIDKASDVARMGYVVFVTDMFGVGRQPADVDAAAQKVGALYADRRELRARALRALEVAQEQAAAWPVDDGRPGMIGFCFGGATALEVARTGAPLSGAVSFHGNLAFDSEAPEPDYDTRLLVLHGDADPFVPPAEVDAFLTEVRAYQALDWQLVRYGGQVHSFTDPHADRAGQAMYDERTARRAFAAMHHFFSESPQANR